MLLLLDRYNFSVKKTQDPDAFYEGITNQLSDWQTDTAYYRDARMHLKTMLGSAEGLRTLLVPNPVT